MIADKVIRDTLKQMVRDATSQSINWPNVEAEEVPSPPYLQLTWIARTRSSGSLSGNSQNIERGVVDVSVHTGQDIGEDEASRICDEIAGSLTNNLILQVSGGVFRIRQPCEIGVGREDGATWRVPVRVFYAAEG